MGLFPVIWPDARVSVRALVIATHERPSESFANENLSHVHTVGFEHAAAAILRAPADGIISVVVAEVGENIHAGQPVLVIEEAGKQWLSFNAREDRLQGLTVGSKVDVTRSGARERMPALVTELAPLGPFATWQAERAVGDHDRSTLRLRLCITQQGLDVVGDASAQ
jgi:hypothetical protein